MVQSSINKIHERLTKTSTFASISEKFLHRVRSAKIVGRSYMIANDYDKVDSDGNPSERILMSFKVDFGDKVDFISSHLGMVRIHSPDLVLKDECDSVIRNHFGKKGKDGVPTYNVKLEKVKVDWTHHCRETIYESHKIEIEICEERTRLQWLQELANPEIAEESRRFMENHAVEQIRKVMSRYSKLVDENVLKTGVRLFMCDSVMES